MPCKRHLPEQYTVKDGECQGPDTFPTRVSQQKGFWSNPSGPHFFPFNGFNNIRAKSAGVLPLYSGFSEGVFSQRSINSARFFSGKGFFRFFMVVVVYLAFA